MPIASREEESESKYSIVEAADIDKCKKKIKADGFEDAYDRFLLTLPIIVEDERPHFKFFGIFRINRIGCDCEAYVAKKIRWKGIGPRLRVVFCLKDQTIQIVEVYFKGKQEVENRDRIRSLCCTSET